MHVQVKKFCCPLTITLTSTSANKFLPLYTRHTLNSCLKSDYIEGIEHLKLAHFVTVFEK